MRTSFLTAESHLRSGVRESGASSLEHIRRDRILHEALATGADPLHLALVFNIDHSNAMAYANAARDLLSGPVPRDESQSSFGSACANGNVCTERKSTL